MADLPMDPTRAEVRSFELLDGLAAHAGRIKVLSLDCFDTLLWRRTATPADVFYDLQHAPPFRALGLTARLRIQAETLARSLRRLRQGQTEVRLPEIYQAAFPDLTAAQTSELAEAELAAEIDACFAFPETVELIRAAKARGLRIVIVSDTYFDEDQLRRLLAATLPADALAAISRVFCSNQFRQSKADGLFRHVISELKVRPDAILHIGDNPTSDLTAALASGLRALRFAQNDVDVSELLRLQGTALALLDPSVRDTTGMPSPFHGVLAQKPASKDGDHLLGYAAAGPILYAFGRFILDELDAMRAQGKRPKPLFLMRDAYLPREVVNAITGEEVGHAVGISRFAAYAASFRSADDVERYLARFFGTQRLDDLAKQLGLTGDVARDLVAAAKKKARPFDEFMRRIRRPEIMKTIFERSAAYRGRLRRYLETTAGVEAGDTVVFVDLGYEGTAQRLLEPVFREEWGVDVAGLYLMVVGTPGWERSRKGLLDPACADERAVLSLVDQVALLEDICTADQDSVVDYDESGAPIGSPRVIAREQFDRVKPVQDACRAFAVDAERFFAATGKRPDAASLRRAALGQLGRLSYFPTGHEMAYLEGFRLDMNLATTDSFRLFDRDEGLTGLRRRGLFFMEHGHAARRMNYPIELRYAGLELAVTFFAQQRYGLSFAHSDFAVRRESVPFVLARGAESTVAHRDAQATHDGYFSLLVPVGESDMNVAVLFGQRYTWVQIESVELVATHALHQDNESHHTEDISGQVRLDGMVERGTRVLECLSEAAFLFIPETVTAGRRGRFACRVVYRPLAYREAAQPNAEVLPV
jgi:FMN phosphatase YigB (HAD superfamily)